MKKPTSIIYIIGIVFTILGFTFFLAGILSKYEILKTSSNSIGDPSQIFPSIGGVFLIISFFLFVVTKMRDKQRLRIISTGHRIIGKINKIKELKYTHYGNKSENPFVIYYSYQFEGISYSNKSHLFWDKNKMSNPGNPVNVFIDKKNAKRSVIGEESEF